MTSNLASIKLPPDLVDDARREAAVLHRSIGGQVEHWARLGRAVESGPGFTLDRVRAALQGELSANVLEPDEERLFHDMWGVYMAGPNPERDALVAKMYAEGGYVGEDENGRLIRTVAGGGVEYLD